MDNMDRSILREYVRSVIVEDGDGGGAGDGFGGWGGMGGYGGGMGGMGGGFGIGDDVIYRTFVAGWVDLFKTATSATKSVLGSAYATARVVFDSIASSVIPFYRSRYKAIAEQHRETQEQIRNEHHAAYSSITSALVSNDDFLVSAFMFDPARFFKTALSNPSAFVTAVGVANAPDAIANTFDVLSGGGMLGRIIKRAHAEKSDWESIQDKLKHVLGEKTLRGMFGESTGRRVNPSQFIIVEEDAPRKRDKEPEKGQNLEEDQLDVIKILLDPAVIDMVMQGREAEAMSRDMRKATEKFLKKIVETVEQSRQIRSLDDVQKITGKPIKGDEDLTPEVEERMVQETKKSIKKMYAEMLAAEAKHVAKVLDPDHDMVKAYKVALKAIHDA